MDIREEASNLCEKLADLQSDGFYFNFIHNGKLVMGSVIKAENYKLSEGVNKQIMGEPQDCANLFYAVCLAYITQIKEIMKYTSDEVVDEIIKRLNKHRRKLDDIPPLMTFTTKYTFKGGNA